MRVLIHLTLDGVKETVIEGDTAIFDKVVDYEKGYDSRLRDIGFWLSDWRYCQTDARPHKKSRVFVPWTSCLMVESNDER